MSEAQSAQLTTGSRFYFITVGAKEPASMCLHLVSNFPFSFFSFFFFHLWGNGLLSKFQITFLDIKRIMANTLAFLCDSTANRCQWEEGLQSVATGRGPWITMELIQGWSEHGLFLQGPVRFHSITNAFADDVKMHTQSLLHTYSHDQCGLLC